LKDNLNRINIRKFIKYLISFPVSSTRRRAGYILENLNSNLQLNKLRDTIGSDKTFFTLDPSNPSRKGNINSKWGIIVNR